MAELYSQYASGVQFQAGPTVGSTLGVSGVNAIVDRLNSISNDNGVVLGSFVGTVISGAGNSLYLSGGQIDKVPSVGDDITNKTYVDDHAWGVKKHTIYTGGMVSGTIIGSFANNSYRPWDLHIGAYYEGGATFQQFRIVKYNGASKQSEIDYTFNTSGPGQQIQFDVSVRRGGDDVTSCRITRHNVQDFGGNTPVVYTPVVQGATWDNDGYNMIKIVSVGSLASSNQFGLEFAYTSY